MSYEDTLQRKFIKEFKKKYPEIRVSHNKAGVSLGNNKYKGRLLKLLQTHTGFLDMTFHCPNEFYPVLHIEGKVNRSYYEKFDSEHLEEQREMAIYLRKKGYYADFGGYVDGEVWSIVDWFYNPKFGYLNKDKLTPYWPNSILKSEGLL